MLQSVFLPYNPVLSMFPLYVNTILSKSSLSVWHPNCTILHSLTTVLSLQAKSEITLYVIETQRLEIERLYHKSLRHLPKYVLKRFLNMN